MKLASRLHHAGHPEEALDAIEEALEITPTAPAALFRRGVLYLELNLIEDALESFREALESDPKNWLIRKQIWALEHPDKFYEGQVDYRWQRAQMKKEGL